MAGLLTDLKLSSSALGAQQMGIQVTGNNLANVNNANYARQSVVTGTTGVMETPIGEQSMGVTVTGVTQSRDPFLDAQVNSETAQSSLLQAQDTQLLQAQANLGEQVSSSTGTSSITDPSQATDGVSSALDNFFNAFTNLAANPSDSGAKDTVYQTAGTLASTINNVYTQLGTLQTNIGSQITQDTSSANSLLKNIATLNQQIQQYQVQTPNSTANDLIDQRQADLQQLAGYMNFTTSPIPNSNGQIEVTTLDANSNPVTLVDKATASTVAFNGSSFTVGSSVLGLTGGSLQGNLSASTGPIQQLMDSLSTTASQITSAVNAQYNPSGATGNFFATSQSSGLASGNLINLDSSLTENTVSATTTGVSGANEAAVNVANVATQNFTTSDGFTGTIGQYYSKGVTSLGESIDGVQSQLSDQNTVLTMVTQQQSSQSGVNEDEEVTNLMGYQRAFQAQAQVVSTLNTMLDVVVSGIFGGTMN